MDRRTIGFFENTLLATVLLIAACSGGNSQDATDSSVAPVDGAAGPPVDGSTGPGDATPPDAAVPAGLIEVRLQPSANWSSLQGYFNDGPALEIRQQEAQLGACRLMTFAPSFCDPACGVEAVCLAGKCTPWPRHLDKGSLEWTWPDGQLTITPNSGNSYHAVGISTQQGDVSITVEDTTLGVDSVEAAEPLSDWAEQIRERTGDVVLTWSNPVAGSRVRLHMTDCAGTHGLAGVAEIDCDAPDTGELTVPDSFLERLEAGDWSHGECGSQTLVRYRAVSDPANTMRLEAVSVTGFFYFPGRLRRP